MRRLRDELDPAKGTGRLSSQTETEYLELVDNTHPRTSLSPQAELEFRGEQVMLADDDEKARCRGIGHCAADSDEPVADSKGRTRDLMADTPPVGVEIGPTDRDVLGNGLPEFDDLGTPQAALDMDKEVSEFDLL